MDKENKELERETADAGHWCLFLLGLTWLGILLDRG
jgi:hypothetical protein